MKKLLGVVLVLAIIGYFLQSAGLIKPKPTVAAPSITTNDVISEKPFIFELRSPTIKLVDGKYRYFFVARNVDDREFNGKLTITLINKIPNVKNGEETFDLNIASGGGRNGYIDANTGPEDVHADACVSEIQAKLVSSGGSTSIFKASVPKNIVK